MSYYLFDIHQLSLVDLCDTDVVFGCDSESSLEEEEEEKKSLLTGSIHRRLSSQ